MVAAGQGELQAVIFLAVSGGRVGPLDVRGRSAGELALAAGHQHTAAWLERVHQFTPLQIAALIGSRSQRLVLRMRWLLWYGLSPIATPQGTPPAAALAAAEGGCPAAAEFLARAAMPWAPSRHMECFGPSHRAHVRLVLLIAMRLRRSDAHPATPPEVWHLVLQHLLDRDGLLPLKPPGHSGLYLPAGTPAL